MNYDEAVKHTWNLEEWHSQDEAERMRLLIHFATLAPSGHNTQCWQFRVEEGAITLLPDFTRRTPVVDPDDHHLYVSLGCATENLCLAARAMGLSAQAEFRPQGDGEIRVSLTPGEAEASPLFEAIASRQCTRSDYDGTPLSAEQRRLLEAAGNGNGVSVLLLTEREPIERALEHIQRANTRQLKNPAFRRELEAWIRFNDAEAVEKSDGLSGRATGNPQAPRWLGKLLMRAMLRPKAENAKLARQVRSSAGLAVFVSAEDDRAHWVEAGRCYQRFALQATALGIRNAFVNQPVEEASVRPAFARSLGLSGERPDLVVRIGRAPTMPRSLRRPVESVITSTPSSS
ncbi:Acg family FMN-binding oxidoreductase [Halomonas lysinitropha]|uniref:NAD(P)H nitroreductase/MT3217 n=1 Tax=Halomonas lysinitropha TaxID=2607506 RepID=A0A5K1I845_9GAMM|nr:nitroreductase family protein [Halomonas lysinitropha]VVZ96367.1 Putative NAD(P)H nitroreductase/MT3217 [Halomonas lysinitropha]